MTVRSTARASNRATRYGNPTFNCGGARIRAHCRHLATVVTIEGDIDAANFEPVSEYTRHFILTKGPLVLDLSRVNSFAAEAVSLLYVLDEDCRAAGVRWTLVAGRAVIGLLQDRDDAVFPTARSVHEALRSFADVIARRRQLLLPLISKTA